MNDDLQQQLSVVRTEIDAIDRQLLDLLNRRARCAQQVGLRQARSRYPSVAALAIRS